jgi:resuscitation-promoting factor RpfB
MRRSLKMTTYAAALAIIAGGTLAWTAVDKTVHLEIDGQPKTVHTLGSHVHDALSAAGYAVAAHDIVAPAPSVAIHDGSRIVLHRGRLLQLTVDGAKRQVWTTEPTVAAALADLGLSPHTFVSVSRDQRLPLSPTAIEVRTPKQVTVKHDGTTARLTTTAATVGQLLTDAGIQRGDLDRLSVRPTAAIIAGQTIVLTRVRSARVTQNVPIPFASRRQPDNTLDVGTTKVVTGGVAGARQITYALEYVDGKLTGRTVVSSKVAKPATPRVVRVGTLAVTPQQIAAQLVAARGWGTDQVNCLTLLWNHESGWQVDAENADSGAYGIPQSLPGDKMASAGPDWQTNPRTQITWGLDYIAGVYGTPCGAWGHELDVNWY